MPFNRPAAMRALHALGKANGYSHDDLRELAASHFGIPSNKVSISKLTDSQLGTLCASLKGTQGKPKGPVAVSTNGATAKQIWKIKALAKEIGMDSNPKRLAGFLQRQCKKSDVSQLTKYDAVKVIDGLKNLIERGIDSEQ